ncbi:MAG: long-chain-acyl-CoA synthetase [Bryobacterales bacterium]|nr:long-chain-acyl-CoA synthetase [Bryobacterales bacterium]
MIASEAAIRAKRASPSKTWRRALELTATIAGNPTRLLSSAIQDWAETSPDAPALLSGRECMSYRQLAERSNRYTRWAIKQRLGKSDVVALLMPNGPEYVAMWLGLTRAGCTVALLNTNLTGSSLEHCIDIVAPKLVFTAPVENIDALPGKRVGLDECGPVTIEDRALYIYTSGTTGLPKAANISHSRIMQWSLWFAGMLGAAPEDRLYNCLPMYHSVGGVAALGAMLCSGGSVVIRERFSASNFWSDIVQWDCTIFQYIGELCRYLMHAPLTAIEKEHRIRVCCGNGLRPDIWEAFKTRFSIPQILEFYASTEGNVSLFNVEGKPGSIGRIPPFLAHRFQTALVRLDHQTGEPIRDERGFCIRCAPDEPGEAIGRIFEDRSNIGSRFEGYTNQADSEKTILRGVFEPADAWFRTGDLMRRDENGYFYFVDRIGDTFRWKGENVSTTEVEQVCCEFPGVLQANVSGVSVPGTDGRAGMATLVTTTQFSLDDFRNHLWKHLPRYAQPLFLRLRDDLETTATFKPLKSALARDGYDPSATADPIFFNDCEEGAFLRVNEELFGQIKSGKLRL